MVQVDAVLPERPRHVRVAAGVAVDGVLARVVPVGRARYHERVLDGAVRPAQEAEVELHRARLQLQQALGVVDELGELALAQLSRAVPEDKHERVNDVGLAAAVGPDDGREVGVEGANDLAARVGLEVFQNHMVHYQPAAAGVSTGYGRGRGRGWGPRDRNVIR